MIFPPLDFSVSLTESAAWTSMNISAIPPCRSQPRWVCTNMQGLDYCNWVTGKLMPPPTFSMTALTRSYTTTATPTSWSPTSYQQYNPGLTYPSPARSLKGPTTASSLLPALRVQCYLIIFSHTTFSKIKTSSICMIHQKWTEALNVILHFFTKQSKLCWFILLGYLRREASNVIKIELLWHLLVRNPITNTALVNSSNAYTERMLWISSPSISIRQH